MLKLLYDLKCGFENKYLTLKDEEYDLAWLLKSTIESTDTDEVVSVVVGEQDFYEQYKDDIESLLEVLEESYELSNLYEASVLEVSKLYFSHLLGGLPLKHVAPIWEPSNWRLIYEPEKRSAQFYLNALPAAEVMKLLKLTKQQLHYYVKVGQLRKEFNPENPKQFKYNRTDVFVLQKKLDKKYDRYK